MLQSFFVDITVRTNTQNNQCNIIGKACFQEIQARKTPNLFKPFNLETECSSKADIWGCLNALNYEGQEFHAAHVIGEVSILPSLPSANQKSFLKYSDLKRAYCRLAVMAGYTERLPAFINLGVDRIFDTWQKDMTKRIGANAKSVKEYYGHGGDELFKGYLKELSHRLQQQIQKYETRKRKKVVAVHILKFARDIVGNFLSNRPYVQRFDTRFLNMVDSFVPESRKRPRN